MANFYYIQVWFQHTKQCFKKITILSKRLSMDVLIQHQNEDTPVNCHTNYCTVHQAMYEAMKTESNASH